MAVVPETIRQNVFETIRALIIDNKPTYTYNEIEYTYSLVAEHNPENPTFPEIVLNRSSVSLSLLNLDGSGEDYEIEVQMDFYAKQKHGAKSVETAQDQLCSTFVNNLTTFKDTDNLIPMEKFWDDSNATPFEDGKQMVYTASSIVKFKLK